MSRMCVLLLVSVFPSSLARAQAAPAGPTLRAGDKVWVSAPDWESRAFEGWLVLLEAGYITVRSNQLTGAMATYRIPTEEITRFEVSIGKDPRITLGMPLGMATLGAILVPAIVTRPSKCVADVGDPDCSGELPYGFVGALGGLVVGGILGSFLALERWVAVPLEHISVEPGGSIEVYGMVRF